MILQAKARPVKIRIKSGGLEHSSLESLKSHFQLKDVCQLLDGRLYRWLLQLGHEDLAKRIKGYTADVINDPPKLLDFYHVFFPADQKDTGKYNNLSDWAFYLIDKADPSLHQQGLNLARDVVRLNKEDAKKMFDSGKLPDEDWSAIFQDYAKVEEDAYIFYILSTVYNSQHNDEKARDYLNKADGLRHEGAQNKLKEQDKAANVEQAQTNLNHPQSTCLFRARYHEYLSQFDLLYMETQWKNDSLILVNSVESKTKQKIYEFFNCCLELKRKYNNADIYEQTKQRFTAAFDKHLQCQSEFVLGLLKEYCGHSTSNPHWEPKIRNYHPIHD